ncbi:hypothetical protein VPHD148_0170 [Vibrio phage D148]
MKPPRAGGDRTCLRGPSEDWRYIGGVPFLPFSRLSYTA